jgi:hypothetical protein
MRSWRQVGPALAGLVLSLATLPQPADAPSIFPLSGRQGSGVTVAGNIPGDDTQKVIVRWDGDDIATCETAPASCAGDPPRGFRLSFQVPDDASPGEHRVVLCLRYCDPISAAWTFVVEPDPPLEIIDVHPGRTAAGGSVKVSGHTGGCDTAGLVLHTPVPVGQQISGAADGSFTATVTVPKGTFPATYRLELRSSCRQVAVARNEHPLEVINHAPQPADDTATTRIGQAVDVPVGANDVDPDGDDGYQTLVVPISKAANGEVQPQHDGTIRYLPRAGFTGLDRFQYRACDVVGAGGRLDCGAASVTVTVRAAGPASPTGSGGTSGGAGGFGPAGSGPATTAPATGPAVPAVPPTSAPTPAIHPGAAAVTMPDWRLGLAVLGAVLAALAVFVRRAGHTRRQRAWARQHVRGEPHPGQARTAVEVDARAAPAPEVRFDPHSDPGVQHLQEGTS